MICGIFGCLMPEKLGGKTALSLFFLCILVAPLSAGQRISLNFPEQEQAELSVQLETESHRLAYSIAEGHILELIREALSREGFPADSLQLNIEEQGESIALNLSLQLPSSLKSRETELGQLLKNSCGIENLDIKWREER